MGLLSFLGVLSPVHINFVTALTRKERVGQDEYGNVYYQAAPRQGYKLPRRWVMYDGAPEASKVPPEWHGWLHHQTNEVPSNEGFRRPWQKPHKANMTGTNLAYRPPGHILEGAQRDKAAGDYEAWTPPK